MTQPSPQTKSSSLRTGIWRLRAFIAYSRFPAVSLYPHRSAAATRRTNLLQNSIPRALDFARVHHLRVVRSVRYSQFIFIGST